MYTVEQLKQGEGLMRDESMWAWSYDGGKTWYTTPMSNALNLNDYDKTNLCIVPPTSQGGWEEREEFF